MLSRMEHDSIGALNVPVEVYYGVQSMRAATNFQITHRPLHPVLIDSIVMVKKAAAITNEKSGKLDQQIAQAIIQAYDEILDGNLSRSVYRGCDPRRGWNFCQYECKRSDCQSCDRNPWWNQRRLQHCTSWEEHSFRMPFQ